MVTRQQYTVVVTGAEILAVVVAAIYLATRTIHTSGIIRSAGIEIYSDALLSTKLTSIDWDNIDVGGESYVDCWIKNTKNTNLTLSFASANWLPDKAQLYLTLTSDIAPDAVLKVGEVINVRLTLTVSEIVQDVEAFSFDVIITGTKQAAKQ